GGNPVTKRYRVANRDYSANFHVFAVEWEPTVIRWFVDEDLFLTVGIDEVTSRGPWRFDHPFYIILNLAVGGVFGGDPDDTTTFPQTLTVDYVRVWHH
ncbi:MAG TPA: glycoside hydrolase family 16 protein, partial [Polyangia bacterium]